MPSPTKQGSVAMQAARVVALRHSTPDEPRREVGTNPLRENRRELHDQKTRNDGDCDDPQEE
ncbi:MAG: hypothetical protein P8R42_02375 [Candidatus Binatia bacterium]|nr:hypothetical protein [Candidatus Binatia bacterium]